MKLKLEFDIPEERELAERYHYAMEAWSAVDDSIEKIRAHDKHGAGDADVVLQEVWRILWDARGKLD